MTESLSRLLHQQMVTLKLKKHPVGLKLTSISGKQTYYEATAYGLTGEEPD